MIAVIKPNSAVAKQWKLYQRRGGVLHGINFRIDGAMRSGQYRSGELTEEQIRILRRFSADIGIVGDAVIHEEPQPYQERRHHSLKIVNADGSPITVKRTGALGDCLLVTPILKRLQEEGRRVLMGTRHPDAYCGMDVEIVDGGSSIDLDNCYESRPFVHIVDAYSEAVFGDWKTSHRSVFTPDRQIQVSPHAVAIHVGGSWPNRTMSPEFWDLISAGLKALGMQPYFVGTRRDYASRLGIDMRVYNGGREAIHTAAAVFSASKLVICNDSALLHLAAAFDTPILGIFTCTTPTLRMRGEPQDRAVFPTLDCRGCHHRQPVPASTWSCSRGDLACISDIPPQKVLDTVAEMLGTSSPP